MWSYETVYYQIYPMGFTGAPFENDGVLTHRIRKVMDWIPHLQKLHVGAVYFSPVFESDTHGYNTRDYQKIDVRLGTNEDFKEVCDYLLDSVKMWIDTFGIDGLRLDVAYLVDRDFLRRLRRETAAWKEDFVLIGEMIGGDYNQIMGDDMCHSVTNYECYKGLYSSLNRMNLFELVHSLMRQFGPEPWTLYRGRHLLNFADNHDVTRLASILTNPAHLPLAYTLLFGMPGMPILYYGSEWGVKAHKSEGDPALRPCFEKPEWNALTDHIAGCAKAFSSEKALQYGEFKSLVLTNRQCVFERRLSDGSERVLVAVNADENPYTAHADFGAGEAIDLITGKKVSFEGGLNLPPCTGYLLKV